MCKCENGCNHLACGVSYLSNEEKITLKTHPDVRLMCLSDEELDAIIHTIDQTYWCHLGKLFDHPAHIFEAVRDVGIVGIIPDILTIEDWAKDFDRDFVPEMSIMMKAQDVFKEMFVAAVLRTPAN